MTNIIDNFTEKTNTNNKFEKNCPITNDLVVGSDNIFAFPIPFNYNEIGSEVSLNLLSRLDNIFESTYKGNLPETDVGAGFFLFKYGGDDWYNTKYAICYHLLPDDSLNISRTYLDTLAQLKITKTDGEIYFTNPLKLQLKFPLETFPKS